MSMIIEKKQVLDVKNNHIELSPSLYSSAGRVLITSGKCNVQVGVRNDAGGYVWLEQDDIDSASSEKAILYYVRACQCFKFTQVQGTVNIWIIAERDADI